MRVLLGYPIWCKPDMAEWIASGIHLFTDYREVDVLFFFDDCDDGSEGRYIDAMRRIAGNHRVLPSIRSADQVYEGGGHDAILRVFESSPEHGLLVVPQDDQRLNDRRFIPSVVGAVVSLGGAAGVIGCRDGFGSGYADLVKSPWSESVGGLVGEVGRFYPRVLHNRGPVCYPKGITSKIGYLDLANFPVWYTETDYAIRASAAGLTNGVVCSNIEHAKFGNVKASQVYDHRQAEDRQRLNNKYPNAGV